MNFFEDRLKEHNETVKRFKILLRTLGHTNIIVYNKEGRSYYQRTIEQYLNTKWQDTVYTPDASSVSDEEMNRFDVKNSYYSRTGNFSVELGALQSADRNDFLFIFEMPCTDWEKYEIVYYYYKATAQIVFERAHLWYLPTQQYKDDLIYLCHKTRLPFELHKSKGSGNPYCLIGQEKIKKLGFGYLRKNMEITK